MAGSLPAVIIVAAAGIGLILIGLTVLFRSRAAPSRPVPEAPPPSSVEPPPPPPAPNVWTPPTPTGEALSVVRRPATDTVTDTPGEIDLRERPEPTAEWIDLSAAPAAVAGILRRAVASVDPIVDRHTVPHDTTVLMFLFAGEMEINERDRRAYLEHRVCADALVAPANRVDGRRDWQELGEGSLDGLASVRGLDQRLLDDVLDAVSSAVLDNLDALDFGADAARPAVHALEALVRPVSVALGDFLGVVDLPTATELSAVTALVAPEIAPGLGPVVRLVGSSVSDELEPGRVLSRVTRIARTRTVGVRATLEAAKS